MEISREEAKLRREFWRTIRARFPGFRLAVVADAVATAEGRGERSEFRSTLDTVFQIIRLCWVSDAFFAQVLYRLKAAMQRRGIPLLPRLAHKLAMSSAQISIGDPVTIGPGLYIQHGQIVIDGLVEIGPDVTIAPWVTIGLRSGNVVGATVERNVAIGTGAKLIGPVRIGAGAQIGANAVVLDDVPPRATVAGAPARVLSKPSPTPAPPQ
ncbi:hypothetical protein BH10ACT11_BH10ACT11_11030 [soil metagenome]